MSRPLKIAVVGAGNWGKNLVRNFDALEEVELAYVCDLSPGVRGAMEKSYPWAKVCDSYQTPLADASVDGVVVAVEVPHHFEVARAALAAGKHVFVEKPLTQTVAEARELVAIAKAGGLTLMVGHLLEYHPAVEHMKTLIEEGQIGSPLYIYMQRLNLGVVRSHENAWLSLAPHDISVACYLFGATPVRVSAVGRDYLQRGIEDVVFANLQFADNRMANIHVSWLDPHKTRKITLVGTEKMVTFDDMEAAEKVRIYDKGAVPCSVDGVSDAISVRSGDILIPKITSGEPLRLECAHFVHAIQRGTSPRSDGDDGLRVVRVLEAGAASLALGGAPVECGQ